jgi:eukaryotic-like serine/threonine-protein kinase
MSPNSVSSTAPCSNEDIHATVVIANHAITPIDDREIDPIEIDLPEIGSELGRYRLEAIRAMGSGSVVFRANHRTLGFSVALKLLNRRDFFDRMALLGQLRIEACVLAQLHHPNIVRLWDFEDDIDSAYLATEYIHGPTLSDAIRDQGKFDPRRAIRIILQIIDALEALWNDRIVHRDIKPDNILLCSSGNVKVIDFGLAMILGEDIPIETNRSSFSWVGTPAFIAPEQIRNVPYLDFRADMYSLGVTLYNCVIGHLPFQSDLASQLVLQHLESSPTPPVDLDPSIGFPLSNVIMRLLEKDPTDRYHSYSELRIALLETLAGGLGLLF